MAVAQSPTARARARGAPPGVTAGGGTRRFEDITTTPAGAVVTRAPSGELLVEEKPSPEVRAELIEARAFVREAAAAPPPVAAPAPHPQAPPPVPTPVAQPPPTMLSGMDIPGGIAEAAREMPVFGGLVREREFAAAQEEVETRTERYIAKYQPYLQKEEMLRVPPKAIPKETFVEMEREFGEIEKAEARQEVLRKELYGERVGISAPSKFVAESGERIAETLRKGEPEFRQWVTEVGGPIGGAYGELGRYSVGFVAPWTETATKVPGGLEVLAKKPEIIPSAMVIGGGMAGRGLVRQAREDPAQLAFDVSAFMLFSYGAGRVGARAYTGALRAHPRYIPFKQVATKPPFITGKPKTATEVAPYGTRPQAIKEMFIRSPKKITKVPAKEVWHAAAEPLPKDVVIGGPLGDPGLYVAPEALPFFAGLYEKPTFFWRAPKIGAKPTFVSIETKGIAIPKGIGGFGSRALKASMERYVSARPTGEAFISPRTASGVGYKPYHGVEVEAKIPLGVGLVETAKPFLTTFRGRKIIIQRRAVTGLEIAAAKPKPVKPPTMEASKVDARGRLIIEEPVGTPRILPRLPTKPPAARLPVLERPVERAPIDVRKAVPRAREVERVLERREIAPVRRTVEPVVRREVGRGARIRPPPRAREVEREVPRIRREPPRPPVREPIRHPIRVPLRVGIRAPIRAPLRARPVPRMEPRKPLQPPRSIFPLTFKGIRPKAEREFKRREYEWFERAPVPTFASLFGVREKPKKKRRKKKGK